MSSLLTAHPKSFEDITEAFRNWRPHSRPPAHRVSSTQVRESSHLAFEAR